MSADISSYSLEEQRNAVRHLRQEKIQQQRMRQNIGNEPPIHIMARLVQEIYEECSRRGFAQEAIQQELVNRTLGDIEVRAISEHISDGDAAHNYRMLADELGIALLGEQLFGYTATGETYIWLRKQMMAYEYLLLEKGYDLHNYDLYGVGNLLLRSWLAEDMQQWGLSLEGEQVHLGLGSMDCLDKVLRGLAHLYRAQDVSDIAFLIPSPGFTIPAWQASSYGYRLQPFSTLPEHHFKLTSVQLEQLLHVHSDIILIYLTIANNPTTFAYTPHELREIQDVLLSFQLKGRHILLLVDLAYIGTGLPEKDHERMAAFNRSETLLHTIFVSSYSKSHTLTGDRFGWVTYGDRTLAQQLTFCWTNTIGTLPAEWQLRFMAWHHLFQERPWLLDKLRGLYRLRRSQLRTQLQQLNQQYSLFEQIYLDDECTIYNWSKFRPGENCFSLFEKIGIAGVAGSVFGYNDEYIRFSIGIHPVPVSFTFTKEPKQAAEQEN